MLGDLYLLKIQCVHPVSFIVTGAVTSLTFSLLIYSLTISFGDIGKALAVVVMVLQIAGSGGTYPIEALPAFFRAVYIFFPFPYAINAMRECIGCLLYTSPVTVKRMSDICQNKAVKALVSQAPWHPREPLLTKQV